MVLLKRNDVHLSQLTMQVPKDAIRRGTDDAPEREGSTVTANCQR